MRDVVSTINELGLEALGRYYSKYRAIVVDRDDPDNMGKIAVIIPQVNMNFAVWAYPSENDGQLMSGRKWITPKKGSIVYVEFQMGDPLYPLWSYHGWAKGEIPDELSDPDSFGFVTPNGNIMAMNDTTREVKIAITDPHDESKILLKLNFTPNDGLEVQSDSIKIKGDLTVDGNITSTKEVYAGSLKIPLTEHVHVTPSGISEKPILKPV